MRKISQALISVSDKSNLKNLLKTLKRFNIKIISSGGTYTEIKKLGFKCREVSDFTGFQEILDGRVKTLHPKIHAGILTKRNNRSHKSQMKIANFENIDLVVVNFYPFEKTIKRTKDHKKIIENIDIGGPSLVRGAAKNYNDVTVLTNIDQYELFTSELIKNNGSTSLDFREKMSKEAFIQTSAYDVAISNYFIKKSKTEFPKIKVLKANLIEKLRYGENSHQEASIYSFSDTTGLKQISGKKLSYNNYNDIYYGLDILNTLPKGVGTIIIKHANPSGISICMEPSFLRIFCFLSYAPTLVITQSLLPNISHTGILILNISWRPLIILIKTQALIFGLSCVIKYWLAIVAPKLCDTIATLPSYPLLFNHCADKSYLFEESSYVGI